MTPPPKQLVLISSLCWWHLSACNRMQGNRTLQRMLSSMEAWCKHRNIKINEDKTWALYVSHHIRLPEFHLTLNGRNSPFVNSVKYLSVIFNKKITWRLHIETVQTNAFRMFIRLYSLLKHEWLSTNIKLTLYTSHYLCKDVCLSCLGSCGRYPSNKAAAPVRQGSPYDWQTSKEYIDLWYAYSLSNSVHVQLHNKIMQSASTCRSKSRKCTYSKYWIRQSLTPKI
jgi:hypothetical protein